jgi:hypothetical protein
MSDAETASKLTLPPIYRWLYPDLANMPPVQQQLGKANVLGVLYSLPLAIIGLVWLASITDVQVFAKHWLEVLLIFIIGTIFSRIPYFISVEVVENFPFQFSGTLRDMLIWSSVLIFGPSMIWLHIAWVTIESVNDLWRPLIGTPREDRYRRWDRLRNTFFSYAQQSLILPIMFNLYRQWGGTVPLPGFVAPDIFLALVVTVLQSFVSTLTIVPFLLFTMFPDRYVDNRQRNAALFFVGALVVQPLLTDPFAVLVAAMYSANGAPAALFLISGSPHASGEKRE